MIKADATLLQVFSVPCAPRTLSLSVYIAESRKLRNGWLVEKPGLAVMAYPSMKRVYRLKATRHEMGCD